MEAGVEAIKVVTRHSMDREKKPLGAAAAPAKRVVCTSCGEPMPLGARADWVVYRTWIVFSESGETGLGEEEYRCPDCERRAASVPDPNVLTRGRRRME